MGNKASRLDWRASLTHDEVRDLLQMRDLRSWLSVATNWGIILGSFALVVAWPNPLTILLALFLIGGRMLGLAILMHEASHRSLFANNRVNDWVGNWLCAYPVWSDLHPYRPYHLQHHAKTGSEEDPDIGLVRPFPITRLSFGRKTLRDLTGQTGFKFATAAARRSFGQSRRDPVARRAAVGFSVTNLSLLGLCSLAGHPALYLLWIASWMTTYTWVTRVRSIAEHAMTPRSDDTMGNTRTTIASPFERLVLAPNRVNYHLEHHLLIRVPHYNLPRMHELLRQRGVLEDACVGHGYWEVLRRATSRGTDPSENNGDSGKTAAGGNGLLEPSPAPERSRVET